MNNVGTVVGIVGGRAAVASDGGATPLPQIGGVGSRAVAVNDAGRIVVNVWVQPPPGEVRAFVWDNDHATQILVPGSAYDEAVAINQAGDVVGTSILDQQLTRAFVWSGGAATLLPTPDPAMRSSAGGINDHGQVVGSAAAPDALAYSATLWDTDGFHDLNAEIAPDAGWRLTAAAGINNAGSIVGVGYLDGRTRAFLLTPVPEPALTALPLAGATAALRRRTRRTARFPTCSA